MFELGEIVEFKFIKDLVVGVEKFEKVVIESIKCEKEICKVMVEEVVECVVEVVKVVGLIVDGVV